MKQNGNAVKGCLAAPVSRAAARRLSRWARINPDASGNILNINYKICLT